MNTTLYALAITAITISFFHTASGPDHYLPFIVLSKSKKWSLGKTILWTIICGLGHVFSSVILGIIGVYLGWQLNKISWLQDVRGNVSSWALFIFGLGYLIYGIWKMSKKHSHKHFDVMGDEVYVHEHTHGKSTSGHHHHHQKTKVTPLVLFAIFVMGPSEPLIPLLFFSGAHRSMPEVITLISTFPSPPLPPWLGWSCLEFMVILCSPPKHFIDIYPLLVVLSSQFAVRGCFFWDCPFFPRV